jgi:hypothetical protein
MNKRILILSVTIIIILIPIFLITYIYINFPDLKPVVEIKEIRSKIHTDKLYIKKKQWGITGDHQLIVISGSPDENFEPDSNKDYIYKGLEPFYYSFSNDTLKITANIESNVPKEMKTSIVIQQISTGYMKLQELRKNYKEKGLEIF